MPAYILSHEGFFVDDADHMVYVIHIDLRPSLERLPVTTLIKGCRKRYAVELCKKIRISKPSRFRKYGEGLIMDPSEMFASRTVESNVAIDDQSELQANIDELANAWGMLPGAVRVTKLSMESWLKATDSHDYSNNGWIFSTSIASPSQREDEAWRSSMPEEYDHVSHIYRPREFARSLGSMIVDQLGPHGQEGEATHSFDGQPKYRTRHRQQMIAHGPVVYVDDPYEVIANINAGMADLLRPFFVREMKYQDQREYRFVILSETEPSDEVMDLDVFLAMLGSMEKQPGQSSIPCNG